MFQFFYFIWTTIAGGQGSIPLGNNKQQNLSLMVQQQINTVGSEYRKDQQAEYYVFLYSQYANTSNSTSEYVFYLASSEQINGGQPKIVNLNNHPVDSIVEWFAFIENTPGLAINLKDMIDHSSLPARSGFGDGMRGGSASGFSKFKNGQSVRWFIPDRDFILYPDRNYINQVNTFNISDKYYQIKGMDNNLSIITLTFYDYDLYKIMYNRIFD